MNACIARQQTDGDVGCKTEGTAKPGVLVKNGAAGGEAVTCWHPSLPPRRAASCARLHFHHPTASLP